MKEDEFNTFIQWLTEVSKKGTNAKPDLENFQGHLV
jgi:hypothetical protein